MNKRIKKKKVHLKITDICEGISEMMSVENHSTIFIKVNTKKMKNKNEMKLLQIIMNTLKRDHDITAIVTVDGVVDVTKAEEIPIKNNDTAWKGDR